MPLNTSVSAAHRSSKGDTRPVVAADWPPDFQSGLHIIAQGDLDSARESSLALAGALAKTSAHGTGEDAWFVVRARGETIVHILRSPESEAGNPLDLQESTPDQSSSGSTDGGIVWVFAEFLSADDFSLAVRLAEAGDRVVLGVPADDADHVMELLWHYDVDARGLLARGILRRIDVMAQLEPEPMVYCN